MTGGYRSLDATREKLVESAIADHIVTFSLAGTANAGRGKHIQVGENTHD